MKSVVGNLSPTGGQLSGTFGGMQQQYMQLDQAQQQLQTWLQAQEAAYAQAAQITTEGEARMTAIRQQAAQANQVIESQKNEIITSATQTMIDSGLQILATGFGEQSGFIKRRSPPVRHLLLHSLWFRSSRGLQWRRLTHFRTTSLRWHRCSGDGEHRF